MSHLSSLGAFILTTCLLTLFTCTGWLIYTQLRARRLGLPTPTLSSYNLFRNKNYYQGPDPAHGGVVGWVRDRVRIFKHRKTHTSVGAFEEPLNSSVRDRARSHGFSALDPDEAWDSRVESETDAYGSREYYEEQEFEHHRVSPTTPECEEIRGRSRMRQSDQTGPKLKPDQQMGQLKNPFLDAAELQDTSLKM